LGPTASGKTKLAVDLALDFKGEIISADSRQIFRGMDIGTGKDLNAYQKEGRMVPHHLIDHVEAGELYNVQLFKADFYKVYEEIVARKHLPILCGGTGMYIHSLLQQQEYTAVPLNPELRAKLVRYNIEELRILLSGYPAELTHHADQSSHKRLIRAIEIAEYLNSHTLVPEERPALNPLVIGLDLNVESRRRRIAERLQIRLREGLVEEVQVLLAKGVDKEVLIYYGLEYKFVCRYLDGELNYDQLKVQLTTAIQQFAKRQMTFFRKMEKDGINIHWLDADQDDELLRRKAAALVCNTLGVKLFH
jgi:tRNA dimethylallyltransferase